MELEQQPSVLPSLRGVRFFAERWVGRVGLPVWQLGRIGLHYRLSHDRCIQHDLDLHPWPRIVADGGDHHGALDLD